MNSYKRVASVLVAALALPLAFASSSASNTTSENRRAVELTFLKSQPGQRENLRKFIQQNWFAMDKTAKAQGLMSDYRMLDTASDEGAWNLIVAVTYPNDKGYDGIKDEFEKIRKAHKTVLIDGKGLRDLGSIVETKRTFESHE